MQSRSIGPRLTAAAVGLFALAHSARAAAFAEDICFPSGGGAPFNCAALPAECKPVGTKSPACLTAALANFLGEDVTKDSVGAMRSMIHADCVDLLAQAVGFSADDAHWISSYGEVPDYGQFEPTDMTGNALGQYQTASLDGFKRTSFTTGGALFHYVPLYDDGSAAAPAGVDGLAPKVDDPKVEYFVAHVRDWAMAQDGDSPPLCAAGLTNESKSGDYATGSGCFEQSGSGVQVSWTWALIGLASKTYTFDTGLKIISTTNGSSTLSASFDSTVGGDATRVANARLGIYLHMLADRISHHECTDTSSMAGPSSSGSSVWSESETSTQYCQQEFHALFHEWETGVDFSKVPSADRTTEAALNAIYDELVAFAKARKTARSGADDAATKSALINAMLGALETEDASGRIGAVAAVACANGYEPFPGAPSCDAAQSDTSSSSSGGCAVATHADDASDALAVLAALAAAAALRRSRPTKIRARGSAR